MSFVSGLCRGFGSEKGNRDREREREAGAEREQDRGEKERRKRERQGVVAREREVSTQRYNVQITRENIIEKWKKDRKKIEQIRKSIV